METPFRPAPKTTMLTGPRDDLNGGYEGAEAHVFLHFNEEEFGRTADEVELLEQALGLTVRPGARVLDLGCGFGRHAIPLAERAYEVWGLDASNELTSRMRRESARRGVTVHAVVADFRSLPAGVTFHGVFSMSSPFGCFLDDEQERRVLAAVHDALDSNGRFLLDVTNREVLVAHGRFKTWKTGHDELVLIERDFDLQTGISSTETTLVRKDGRSTYRELRRRYTLAELCSMLDEAGFAVVDVIGGYRRQPYSRRSPRLIVVAEKRDPMERR